MTAYTYIRLEKIDLGIDGMHFMVPMKIGTVQTGLILETGASATVFDLELMNQILPDMVIQHSESLSAGLGTNSMQSFKALIPSLNLGNLIIKDFDAALLDLSHINAAYNKASLPSVHGVLGNDILGKYQAMIDYKKYELRLTLKKTAFRHQFEHILHFFQ